MQCTDSSKISWTITKCPTFNFPGVFNLIRKRRKRSTKNFLPEEIDALSKEVISSILDVHDNIR